MGKMVSKVVAISILNLPINVDSFQDQVKESHKPKTLYYRGVVSERLILSMTSKGPVSQAQAQSQIQPNQTLYVNNLNTKVKKMELKRMLYALFSAHGQILAIVASKTSRCRGQAFIVYKELSSAVIAMRALQGYPFYDKSLRIQFAKSKSEAAKDMEVLLAGGTINYGKILVGKSKFYFFNNFLVRKNERIHDELEEKEEEEEEESRG